MAEKVKESMNYFSNLWSKIIKHKAFPDFSSSVVSIVFGLIFGLLVMIFVNPGNAIPGFLTIISGGFTGGLKGIGNQLYTATPLILTGLSIAFAFRTGLFNIGASGQLTIGAFIAVFIGVQWEFLGSVQWIVAVFGAILGGAVWGAIPGFLKAYRNVNEVVASIMLNYVAMYLNSLLIVKFIYHSDIAKAYAVAPTAEIPTFGLDLLFPKSSINGSFLIALLVVFIIHIILNKTVFGYELKAVGFNRNAAKYAGMNEKRNIVLSMAISGAIAGLAGATVFLVSGKNLDPVQVILAYGFDGIAISLLGLSSPIGVTIAALFYSSLKVGGFYVQIHDFNPEIIDIIIASIIYFSALSLFIRKFVLKYVKKKNEQEQLSEGGNK
jgi:simple sugar transport system permease protein